MQCTDHVYMVGSGALGCRLTNEYDCNVYLIDAGGERLLVDCGAGMDTEAILARAADCGFNPFDIGWIFVTHHHADHSGGAAKLRSATGARIVASPATAAIAERGEAAMGLDAARELGIYPADYRYAAWKADRLVQDNETMRIGKLTLRILATPGHSRDHIAVYCPELKALFSSDLVFDGGRIAVQPSADFSLEDVRQSLSKLADLEIRGLFPGHGPALPEDGGETLRRALRVFAAGEVPESIV